MLGMVLLARLNLGALGALLAIVALRTSTLLISSRLVILSRDLVLDVRRDFVEGAMELVEQTETAAAAAARGALLGILYYP